MNWNRSTVTVLLFAVAALAHGPVLVEYAARMWTKGHYQFFPVLFLVVGYLFFTSPPRFRKRNPKPPGALTFVALAILLAMVLLATGLNSPFLGILSFGLLICTAIGTLLGADSLKYMARFLWILVFVVPMPLNFDAQLIVTLQFWASGLASTFLDALGFVHFREGVVISTAENRFLTEEACSGIRSLFSALAAVALLGYWRNYPWMRQVVNLVHAGVWVLVGNAVRIVTVVVTADYGMPFFAHGVGHDLLGVGCFGLIVLLVVSLDRVLGLTVFRFWDEDEIERDDFAEVGPVLSDAAKRQLDQGESSAAAAGGGSGAGVFSGSTLVSWLFVGAFLLVIGLGVRLAVAREPAVGFSMAGVARLPSPQKSDLPDQINGWTQQRFYLDHRGEGSLFAEYSYIWVYQKEGAKALLSLDCPYPRWHDLSVCYRGIGWECRLTHEFGVGPEQGQFSRIEMTKPDGTLGRVLFTAVDRNKTVAVPGIESGYFAGKSLSEFLVYRLSLGLMLENEEAEQLSATQLPITGFQLLTTSGAAFDEEAEDDLRTLFLEAREHWLASGRFTATQTAVAADESLSVPRSEAGGVAWE